MNKMKRAQFIVMGILAAAVIVCGAILISKLAAKGPNKINAASEETLFREAQALEAQGSLSKARDLYQKLITDYPQGKFALENQKLIWDLNIKILFSPNPTAISKVYEVQAGDTLGKIAKKCVTTVDLVMKTNGLKSSLIRPGMKLKVCTAKFTIFVDKSQNTLTLKANDEIFKIYQAATGLDNCTPVGTFKIVTKIVDPTWYKAGAVVPPGSPKNILGTRWLGLSVQGYGIHGTTEPESMGKQVTAGCVRMINKDVEELYAIVPIGTDVTAVD